jgi:hypothetical protein
MIKNFNNVAGREYWVCGTEPGHQERRVAGNCVAYQGTQNRRPTDEASCDLSGSR